MFFRIAIQICINFWKAKFEIFQEPPWAPLKVAEISQKSAFSRIKVCSESVSRQFSGNSKAPNRAQAKRSTSISGELKPR